MSEYKDYSHILWRNSALSARISFIVFSIDAKPVVLILLVLFRLQLSSIYIFLGAMAFFGVLEFYGFSLPVALRRFRSVLAGRKRFVHSSVSRRRRFING